MKKIMAYTAATGTKSGGAFSRLVAENINAVNNMFPDGIRALVRNETSTAKLEEQIPSLELYRGSIFDKDLLRQFLQDVDTLVHIAGISFSPNIVEVAAECNVRRMILVHTTGIYSKYKSAGEEYRRIEDEVYRICKEKGVVLTICRPTMIYGNITDNNIVQFITMVDKFPIMPVVSGARYKLQPVHYTDLAKAYFAILMHEEKTKNKDYILSGGAPIELRDMLTIMGNHLGKKVRFISCPFWAAYAGAWIIYCITGKRMDYREKVQRLCEHRTFSFEEAQKDFGYTPMPFEEGIGAEVKEYKARRK